MHIITNELHIRGNGKKVFISSTSYDLLDLRSEVATALKDWGFVPVWHESPDFPVQNGLHSHDVCLDQVRECDIYVLIIGGRYGGTYSGSKYPKEDISITWYETKIAFQDNKRTLKFIRENVWNEKGTYKHNLKDGTHISPFHVDDPRVFQFIDFVIHQPIDNWIYRFKDSVDLKEQIRRILQIESPPYRLPYFKTLRERLND